MIKKKYAQKKAEQFIQAAFNTLIRLYQKCLALKERSQASSANYTTFINSNGEFEDMRRDAREGSRMLALLFLVVLTALVDYILTYQALDILCATLGLNEIYKVIAPIVLILLEVFISYVSFTAMYRRGSGYGVSLLDRILPYAVILILIGLSLSVIVYSLTNFANLEGYSFWTIITQIVLLIASILLHICIIRNAVDIGEMFAYEQYKIKRNILAARQNGDKRKLDKGSNRFMSLTRGTVMEMHAFHAEFTDNRIDFSISIPVEVVKAIVIVMGRDVFRDDTNRPQIPD